MPSTGTLSNYLANAILDASVADGSWPTVSAAYLALSKNTVNAGDGADTPTEPHEGAAPTWSNYARQQLLAASLSAAASRAKTNSAQVSFGTATTSGGDVTLTDWFVADSASGAGNILWYGKLDGNIIVQNGNPVNVPIGSYDLAFSAALGTPP